MGGIRSTEYGVLLLSLSIVDRPVGCTLTLYLCTRTAYSVYTESKLGADCNSSVYLSVRPTLHVAS